MSDAKTTSTSTFAMPPIQETIQRVTAAMPYIGVRFGPLPDGWLRASDVVTDQSAVSGLLDEVQNLFDMDNRQVAASFLVLGYFWYPMIGVAACYLLEQRVPDLSAGAIAVHLRGGATFLSPHCWALAEDPDADHPDVTVVADLGELRAQLVRQLEEQHATPLFATLRSVAPYGINGMRANYIDRLASALLWLTEQLGDDDLARREVPAFVALASPKARTGIVEIEHDGRCGVFLQRGGCCLNYRLPGREKCDTCSLWTADERTALLRQHLVNDTPLA